DDEDDEDDGDEERDEELHHACLAGLLEVLVVSLERIARSLSRLPVALSPHSRPPLGRWGDSRTAHSGRDGGFPVNRRRRAASLSAAGLAAGLLSSTAAGRDLDVRLFRAANKARGRASDLVAEGATELGSIWASVGAFAALSAAGERAA